MRPDISLVVSILALWAALSLIVPKRRWAEVAPRVRETAAGSRRHVFGPPAPVGPPAQSYLGLLAQGLRAEWGRAFVLGVPLWLVALEAERRGADRRREREAVWRESPSGLTFRHLAGELTTQEFEGRLRERGYPLPAPKAVVRHPRPFLIPPMRERWEWEQRLKELEREAGDQAANAEPVAPPMPAPPTHATPEASPETVKEAAPEPAVEIRMLGEVRIIIDGEDVAAVLLHQPAQAFIVVYLLLWEMRRPGDRVTRDLMAEEIFRGHDPEDRRRSLRQRLANLSRQSPALRRRIKSEGEYLSFDVSGCDIDARRVFEVAERVAAAGGVMSDQLLAEAVEALALAERPCLPGWESIESRGTLGGSGASEIVAEVRDMVVAARLVILAALADAALAGGRPDEAVSYLEQALDARPERLAVARKLVDAYVRVGQMEQADRLRRDYGLAEAP